jgi:hypothetical protein
MALLGSKQADLSAFEKTTLHLIVVDGHPFLADDRGRIISGVTEIQVNFAVDDIGAAKVSLYLGKAPAK